MKRHIFIVFFTLSAAFSITALAESEKNISVGFAAYSLTIAYSDAFANDDEFSGTAISALYATSNRVAFRGTYYSLDHDDLSMS
ncbi:hypothetical protein MNBD_GAMMA09-1012 [hydrothermal vent metagenome]|uniref:Outer membrane protein beta-barrel domain-containing protein n=1 Tax=hydrothermal vent metagenome TaxID=652676 RepID=A0A3B0XAD3_9ZZZZ